MFFRDIDKALFSISMRFRIRFDNVMHGDRHDTGMLAKLTVNDASHVGFLVNNVENALANAQTAITALDDYLSKRAD